MAKSAFTRIFLTIVLIMIVSSILTTSLLYSQLGSYIVRTQSEELTEVAKHVAEITGQVLDDNNATRWLFQRHIETQSSNNDCVIMIMNAQSDIVAMSGETDFLNPGRLDSDLISRALEGKGGSEISTEKSKGINKDTFIVAEPVSVNYNGEFVIWGAVVVCKPMPEIRQTRSVIMRLIITAQLIALLIAFLVSFVLARSFSRPISKLSTAVKAVAAGDFTKKIEYKSKDEIGELIAGFNYMTEALKEIDEARSSFISNVAHELRTPMTIISGFVEGIIDGTISEDERDKYLAIVLSESQRLSRLVTELLETSRLESGTTKFIMKKIDINELLRKGIISYENAITQKNIEVEAEFKYEHSYALGDEDSIYRVIMNLMDNAVKFTPDGGVIRVKSSEGVRRIEVSIENTGAGISARDLSRIWERFYKSDKSRSMDKRGVGLGLYLVKTIINQHNNRIWAESREGEYTRFTFTLDKFNDKKTD